MTNSIRGVILASQDYKEADVLLQVLTEDNVKMTMHARGVRKIKSKNSFCTQLFMECIFKGEFKPGKRIHTVRSIDVINGRRHLRESLLALSCASIISEMILYSRIEKDYTIYEEINQLFNYLQSKKQPYAVLTFFVAKMNNMLGIYPYVDGCVCCKRLENICSFSLRDGGFICTSCFHPEKHVPVSKEMLHSLRMLYKAEFEDFEKLEQSQNWNYEHFDLVYSFFEEYSGINLKSVRFLDNMKEILK